MEQIRNYRHELKYEIPYAEYVAMRARLKLIMKPDPHADVDGRYRIRSIYFDNSDDKALREKIDGIGRHEKFRIRYYNDDLSFILLEKKMKTNNLCLKSNVRITEEECRKILTGDTVWMRDSDEKLIKEFYAKMRYQRLKPRVLVSYVREPYIYQAGNARITFSNLLGSWNTGNRAGSRRKRASAPPKRNRAKPFFGGSFSAMSRSTVRSGISSFIRSETNSVFPVKV